MKVVISIYKISLALQKKKDLRPLKSVVPTIFILLISYSSSAHAGWRFGLGVGFGGSGIKKQVLSEELGLTVAEKSEGPGILHLSFETVAKLRYVVGFEHSRGFRLGPFSAGIGFTSVTLRWHYLRAAPEVSAASEETSLYLRRWSPYTGGYFGIAEGTVKREGEIISTVSASGVHFGLKNGIDYSYRRNLLLRWELSAATTFFQSSVRPATLTEFSLWMGVIFSI